MPHYRRHWDCKNCLLVVPASSVAVQFHLDTRLVTGAVDIDMNCTDYQPPAPADCAVDSPRIAVPEVAAVVVQSFGTVSSVH